MDFKNNKIIEFTKNGENCDLESNETVVNDLKDKLDIFGWSNL